MPHDPHPHDHCELSRQLRDSRQELAHAKLLIDKLKTEIDAMLADDDRFALRARRQFDDFERRLSHGSKLLFDLESD